jgi:hypothetical protein
MVNPPCATLSTAPETVSAGAAAETTLEAVSDVEHEPLPLETDVSPTDGVPVYDVDELVAMLR